jgi:phosphomannomutase
MGLEVIDAGLLPTPALALEAMRLRLPAIMVTCSHIPADRNGLKRWRRTRRSQDDDAAKPALHPSEQTVGRSARRAAVPHTSFTFNPTHRSLSTSTSWPQRF